MKIDILKYIIYFILIVCIYQLLILLYASIRFLHKHFLCSEIDMTKRYGKDGYIIITGASSGQGKFFAKEFAKRGFNLILIGSERTQGTIDEINNSNSDKDYQVSSNQDSSKNSIDIIFIKKDFRKAYQPLFFSDIEETINNIDGNICGLVNNVAHRSAWNPYHNMPEHLINDTIIVGTIVQSQLTRICIKHFLERQNKSFIINITAQCIFPTFGLGQIMENNVTVPFLSVYEGANAFGFYQGNSIHKEYSKFTDKLDILNIMPGAVVTENTKYLGNTIFSVGVESFVKNILKQLGCYNGNSYGYWGHEFSVILVNLFPFVKDKILYNVGYTISSEYMKTPAKKY